MDLLHEDRVGQFLADAQPRIADLADKAGFAGDQFDPLLLAESQFAEPLGHLRSCRKLLDADLDPRLHAAQGTNLRAGTAAFQDNQG